METVVFTFGFAKIARVPISASAHSSCSSSIGRVGRVGDGRDILEAVARSTVPALFRRSAFSTVCNYSINEGNYEKDPEHHSSMVFFGHY